MPYFHFFVWNNYKRELIKINGTFCSEYKWSYHYHQSLNLFNNEYVQANYQKYNFTYQDHIYEKNHKIYQYNNETLKFDEIEYHENIKLSYIFEKYAKYFNFEEFPELILYYKQVTKKNGNDILSEIYNFIDFQYEKLEEELKGNIFIIFYDKNTEIYFISKKISL